MLTPDMGTAADLVITSAAKPLRGIERMPIIRDHIGAASERLTKLITTER